MNVRAGLAEALYPPVRVALAILAGSLPRRVWSPWEGLLPMGATALAAALVPFFLGFAVGIPGYLEYARWNAEIMNEIMLRRGGTVVNHFSLLTLFTYVIATPVGLASAYLVSSGLVRSLACVAGDPMGDPLLTAGHAAWSSVRGQRLSSRERDARERLEGPEVPDVLLTGRNGGAPEADYVVVASRRKEGWTKGAFVVTSDRRFRLGAPFDRRFPGGLRAVYPLVEATVLEVSRRPVYYELPRLSESYLDPPSPPS